MCVVRCLVLSVTKRLLPESDATLNLARSSHYYGFSYLVRLPCATAGAWSVPAPLRPPRSVLTPGPGPCLMRHGSWSWSCRPRQHPGVGGRCHTFDVHGLPNAEKRDTRRRGWGRVSKGAGGAEAVGSRTAYAWALAHDEMESREVHPK